MFHNIPIIIHHYPNNNFWRNKIELITGHTGFKGSWLTCLLLKFGCKVYGLSLPIDNTFILNQELIKDENFDYLLFYL